MEKKQENFIVVWIVYSRMVVALEAMRLVIFLLISLNVIVCGGHCCILNYSTTGILGVYNFISSVMSEH